MSYRVKISSQARGAMFDIRGDAGSMQKLLGKMQLCLPQGPHAMLSGGGVDVIRLGPKRALVRTAIERELALETEFRQNSNFMFVNATCISDMYHGISLEGADVAQVLCQMTPLNLHHFPPGAATATEIFSMAGLLVHESKLTFSVYVESSYADYVLERLQKCALRPGA